MNTISTQQLLLGAANLTTTGNNVYVNGAPITVAIWNSLTFASTTLWNAQSGVLEDKKILILTGNTTLTISGLYNGWVGSLQTIQSGASSSGYALSLPNGTKVLNSGSGIAALTRTSGAIDVIGFEYDGTKLLAAIGSNFN